MTKEIERQNAMLIRQKAIRARNRTHAANWISDNMPFCIACIIGIMGIIEIAWLLA